MPPVIVRPANPDDLGPLAALIDGFAKGHPAESCPRRIDTLRTALFSEHPVAHVLLAETGSTVIGFGAWRKTYDMFWSLFGGDGLGLYVVPSHRGRGVAVCIVAAICDGIRKQGGVFLQTSYDPALAPFYERVAVGRPERACHVSARAFAQLANLAGRPTREIIRGLPGKALNHVPV